MRSMAKAPRYQSLRAFDMFIFQEYAPEINLRLGMISVSWGLLSTLLMYREG